MKADKALAVERLNAALAEVGGRVRLIDGDVHERFCHVSVMDGTTPRDAWMAQRLIAADRSLGVREPGSFDEWAHNLVNSPRLSLTTRAANCAWLREYGVDVAEAV